MPPLRRKKRRKTAYATIHYGSAVNEKGKRALCIHAQCQFADTVVGPIWGHGDASMRAALSELTRNCECPATYHKVRDFSGRKVTLG